MYANNLFTLNNIPTLSVGGKMNSAASVADTLPITSSDMIFVSAVQLGRVVLDTCLTGFADMTALMHELKRILASSPGLITVNLRNRSCGWASKRVVRIGRSSFAMPPMA